jgi:hypothetical protein
MILRHELEVKQQERDSKPVEQIRFEASAKGFSKKSMQE